MTNCKYCKADCARRGEDREKECRGYIPMTNGDHIRAMNDETLARFLAEVENRRSAAGGGAIWKGAAHAKDWLKQPYKEPTNTEA